MTITNKAKKTDQDLLPVEEIASDIMEIKRLGDGRLSVYQNNSATQVKVCLCFPWTKPGRYISLRDEKNNEIAFIKDINELEPLSQQVVAQAMAEAGFVLQIQSVESLKAEFEIRNWRVTTRQGSCTFQTELDDWPRLLPDGGMLIKDVAGNLFHIADPKALDEKSRKILWAFID